MTGDWGGARTELEEAGIRLDLFYVHNYGVNTRGGRSVGHGTRHSGSYDSFVRLDLERLKLIPGGFVLVHTRGHYNDNVNGKVGALGEPFDDADGDHAIYIDQFYYEQALLARKLRWRFGYLDQQTIIDRNAYANSEDVQFSNTYLDNNNAIIPLAIGLGTTLFFDPTDWLGFVFGAADGGARLYHGGFDTAFHGPAEYFGYFETDVRISPPGPNGPLPGTYRFGTFYDPRGRPVFGTGDADDPPEQKYNDVGFYVSFDQMLFREKSGDDQGLGWFFRYGFRHDDVNRISNFWSTGAQYQGLIPGRDDDLAGFGMYQALSGERYESRVDEEFYGETGYEMYYNIALTPWLSLTQDLQYIRRPGGSESASDSFVLGWRARINF